MGLFSGIANPVSQIGGGIASGIVANNYLNKARGDLRDQTQHGIDTLTQGREGANTAYSPYTQAGASAIPKYSDAIDASGNIGVPQQSAAFDFNAWKNPQADYVRDNALAAMNAGSVASGRFSSGTVKNMQTTAGNIANGVYNDAYNNYLKGSDQSFGQQQTQYQDRNQQEQQKINNLGNLSGVGLNATNSNQQLVQGYNKDINTDYTNLGTNLAKLNTAKGENWQNTISNTAGQLPSLFGGLSNLF